MRYGLNSMIVSYFLRDPENAILDKFSKATNPISQIFGIPVTTTACCVVCNRESVTHQKINDLVLDIHTVNTLKEALDLHFACECIEDYDTA